MLIEFSTSFRANFQGKLFYGSSFSSLILTVDRISQNSRTVWRKVESQVETLPHQDMVSCMSFATFGEAEVAACEMFS